MKVVLQRVCRAEVNVRSGPGGEAMTHCETIGAGLVALVCVEVGDDESAIDWAADKTAKLRIFQDDAEKMNRSVVDERGGVLVISQFTLAGDTSKGNRPSFITAARPEIAAPLVERFAQRLEREHGLTVARGVFGAMMDVTLTNAGPVTVIVER